MSTTQSGPSSGAPLPPNALCTLAPSVLSLVLGRSSCPATVATLGPPGTSSESTALHLQELARDCLAIELGVDLCPSFDDAVLKVRNGTASVALVPNAYPGVATYYMAADLAIAAAVVHATPPYGLATNIASLPRTVVVSSHRATIARIAPLLREAGHAGGDVEFAESTVAAAEMAAHRAVHVALTNVNAAEQFNLRFITRTEPIRMLWSLFMRATDAHAHAR